MSKKSNDVVITAALRTPIGTYKGSLKGLSADKLGALAIKEAVYKSKLKSDDIDEVIMGCVLPAGQGQAPARQAADAHHPPCARHRRRPALPRPRAAHHRRCRRGR